MTIPNDQITDISKSLIQLMRKSYELRLKQHFSNIDFKAVAAPVSNHFVYDHWMAMVLIASPELRINSKIFYNSDAIRKMGAKALNQRTDIDSISDFMKEFCNMSAGLIRTLCTKVSLNLGISLPCVTRGFDEVFLPQMEKGDSFRDVAAFGWDGNVITCVSQVQINRLDLLSKIDFAPIWVDLEEAAQGSIEYF